MKDLKFIKLSIIFALMFAMVSVGCKNDPEDEPVPEKSKFEILSEYLTTNNLDLTNMLDAWIAPAYTVSEDGLDTTVIDLSAYYIMDIRAAADFATGHLTGANQSSLETIVDDASAVTDKILVACYTGQTAAHAVIALRLSGHTDAQVLKFGMASWNSDFAAKWNDNIGDAAVGNASWVTTDTETSMVFSAPTITSEKTSGAEILAEQVALLSEFKGVTNADVLATPANYFINNFWDEADVTHYGHIDGAYRIKPLSIAGEEYLNLDPSATIITYCWTGQTSSMVTAYLTVLGYDAKSLKFGTNGMIHSELESHKWSTTAPGEFDYETGN